MDLDIILLPSFPPSLPPSSLPSFLPSSLPFTHPFLPSFQVLVLVHVECRRSVVYDLSLEITIVRYLEFQELCVVSMVVGNLVVGWIGMIVSCYGLDKTQPMIDMSCDSCVVCRVYFLCTPSSPVTL